MNRIWQTPCCNRRYMPIYSMHFIQYTEDPNHPTSLVAYRATLTFPSLSSNNSTKPLHRLHDLSAVILGHAFLHDLGRALDKLLAVHQA